MIVIVIIMPNVFIDANTMVVTWYQLGTRAEIGSTHTLPPNPNT